jgi:hypothetical protein
MRRQRRSGVVLLAALTAGVLAGGSLAKPSRGPFPLAPSRTQECHNLAYCFGIAGLWVVIPAHGEATYLFGCPPRSETKGAFLLGGTDALASSGSVRVWYDGKLGAPIGAQTPGSGLLFHAVTNDGSQGSFRPILGCISLSQATKRSTVSARRYATGPAGGQSAQTPRPRATNLILAPGDTLPATAGCLRTEKLVGSWSAVAYGTAGPPRLPPPKAVKIVTHETRGTVSAEITTANSIPYLIHIQIGAICEPRS